jgi:hypothetical protein
MNGRSYVHILAQAAEIVKPGEPPGGRRGTAVRDRERVLSPEIHAELREGFARREAEVIGQGRHEQPHAMPDDPGDRTFGGGG